MKFFATLAVSWLAVSWAQTPDVVGPVDGDGVTNDPVPDGTDDLSVQTTPQCDVANCITCYEADMCQSCESGYSATHDGTDGTCKECQVTNCGECDDHADECQQCITGYYLETSDDTTESPPVNGTSDAASQSQVCVACSITGCGECAIIDGIEECDACAEGYYKAEDGTCATCGDNCAECANVDPNGNVGGCLQCDDLYEPEYDGSCGLIGQDCGDYCDVCEEHNQCKTCQDGYSVMIFNNGNSVGCAPCPPNCASCADAETCDVCEDGFTLDDISGSCATPEEIVANVCDCRSTENNGCTCPGDEEDAKDGCCDAGGLCGGTSGVCYTYNNDVCSDYDNCAYCFGQSFCGACDTGYYKTNGHPWGACIPLPDGWDLDVCGLNLLYNDQCECGCGGVDPECAAHQVDNCVATGDSGVYCDATAECAECTITGCAFCENGDSPTECHVCMDGYDLNEDLTCDLCDIDGCSSCQEGITIVNGEVTATTVCKECMDGYFGSVTDGDCTACDDTNCVSCSEDTENGGTICNQCADGYSLDSTDGSCNQCSDNCLQCGATQCNRCESGYEIVSGACHLVGDCGDNCDTCQRGGQCKICTAGYFVGAGTNGKCVACMDNCDVCRDGESCSTCSDGYSFDINEGSCLAAGECLADVCDCRESDNDGCVCLEDENSAKLGCCNEDCGLCSDHCADYTGDVCTDFANCEYCYGQTYCMECQTGYYQQEYHGDCIALPDGWDLTLDGCGLSALNNNECNCECGGYDPDCDDWPADGCDDYQYCSLDGLCSDCNVAGCLHCANGNEHETDAGICMECTDGHYSDEDGNCFDCNLDGCAVCLMTEGGTVEVSDGVTTFAADGYTCKECQDGYYMNDQDTCSSCDVLNCAVCSLDGSCEECETSYSLGDDGSCAGCIDNCIDCTGDTTSCKRCADNYEVLDDGTCGALDNLCGDACAICGAAGACKSCENTYYKDSASECQSCMENCGSCTSATTCAECTTGYGFQDGSCQAYSDPLEYCDLQIKDNVFSEGTECVCDGWECSAISDTTTSLPLRGRQ